MKQKKLANTSKIESSGYLAFNGDTMEYEDIKNSVIRFGVEKFKLSITDATESLDFLSRLFLKTRNKNEFLIKKDCCVTKLTNFRPKTSKYPELSYRVICSFMFEYEYEGIIENAPCSIVLRNDKDKKFYNVLLSTNSSDYSNNVEGHLTMFNSQKIHPLFDVLRSSIEFDIFHENEKIGWGYFLSGLNKIVYGMKK